MGRNPDLDENSAGTRITASNTTGNGVAPQITSTIGVPEPPPEVIEATGGSGAVTVLNPNAPVNRLSEGGIVFAYPDLVYSQFIDIDQQIEVTDDTSPNSLVLQIPYHPISQYTNEFIQSYARMHGRYNGDLIFRAQIIGNATFSGTLMWFWWPRKYPSSVVKMADAMKYSYKSQSIQLNSVEELVLHDARQYLYYRDMDEFDVDSRPHMVLMVHTSIQSPLKEGVKIRIRIGSRLASASPADRMKMVTPFIFANPLPLASSGGAGEGNINGKKIPEVLPHYRTSHYRMVLDGNTTAQYSLVNSQRYGTNFTFNCGIPGVSGRDGRDVTPPDTNNWLYRRTPVESGTTDKNCLVYVIHQLPPSVVLNIAAAPAFATMTTPGADQAVQDVSFIKNHIKVYAVRSIAPNLAIDTGLTLARQTTCYTNYGKIVVVLVNVDRSEISDYENLGFPNIGGGTNMMYPHSDILGPTNFTNNLNKLPGNWVALKFSDEEPSIVNSNTDIAPSLFTDVSTLEYFKDLTANLVEDQVLQFDLVDGEAKIRVATLRYIPGRQEFVINPIDSNKYKLYAGDINNLVFANYGIQPAAASFPVTDTTTWLGRTPSSSLVTSNGFISNKMNLMTARFAPI